MNMNMSEVLESAHGYLQQLSSIEGEYAVDVPPVLFETLQTAAQEAKSELEGISTLRRSIRQRLRGQ